MRHLYYTPHLKTEQSSRGSRKAVEPEGIEDCREKMFSGHEKVLHIWTHRGYDRIHKTYTDPSNQTPSTNARGAYDVPPLAEELLATDDCWGNKSPFSSVLWTEDYSCSRRQPYPHAHTSCMDSVHLKQNNTPPPKDGGERDRGWWRQRN